MKTCTHLISHLSLFSTARWDLANSRPVHSLMLSSGDEKRAHSVRKTFWDQRNAV